MKLADAIKDKHRIQCWRHTEVVRSQLDRPAEVPPLGLGIGIGIGLGLVPPPRVRVRDRPAEVPPLGVRDRDRVRLGSPAQGKG